MLYAEDLFSALRDGWMRRLLISLANQGWLVGGDRMCGNGPEDFNWE